MHSRVCHHIPASAVRALEITSKVSKKCLTVSDLSAAQKKEFRMKAGVRVDAAVEAAARAGLREGDVIVAIANVEIAGVREFEAMLAKLDKKKPVSVLFRRGDWAQYAVIRPSR